MQAINLTYLQSGKETSSDLKVGDMPLISLGSSFNAGDLIYSFRGVTKWTRNETRVSNIAVHFYGFQVHISVPTHWPALFEEAM